jgi:hypothetical protein
MENYNQMNLKEKKNNLNKNINNNKSNINIIIEKN